MNCLITRNVVVSLRRKCYNDADEEKVECELSILVGSRVILISNLWSDSRLFIRALQNLEMFVYSLARVYAQSTPHMF